MSPCRFHTTGRQRAVILAAWCALFTAATPAGSSTAAPPDAAPAAPAAEANRHPTLRRLSRTHEVWIDARARRVIVGGEVALDRGPIEVFACPAGTKEHEAVVATNSTAQLVHVALLAIGLEPGHPVTFNPDYVPAAGPAVDVRVRWKDAAGTEQEARAGSWIRNAETGRQLDVDFVFAGSTFWTDPLDGKEYYQADGGDLICVSNFPTATLDLPIESSQSNDALLFEAFAGRVPPPGTRVDLILVPMQPEAADAQLPGARQ
jgi:hypothetical protein